MDKCCTLPVSTMSYNTLSILYLRKIMSCSPTPRRHLAKALFLSSWLLSYLGLRKRPRYSECNTYYIYYIYIYIYSIDKYFTLGSGSEREDLEFSSMSSSSMKVLEQTFVMPNSIKGLGITETKEGITNKHILLILNNNQIISVPQRLLTARRPKNEEYYMSLGEKSKDEAYNNEEWENNEYPVYDAVLPISYHNVITYNLTVYIYIYIYI